MKKIFFLLFLLVMTFHIDVIARTTYIPTYYTQINVVGSDTLLSDSTARRELSVLAKDGRYSITILHDSVTAERVKAIKAMKAASGWATAAAVFSGVSTALNPVRTSWDAVNYMSSMHNMVSSSMLSVAARNGTNNLQKVPVSIIVENLSDREMVVNDMTRGLTWYVPAENYIELNVGNPEVNKLRIANADGPDLQKDYITVQAANFLEKHSISYEDEDTWYFPVYVETEESSPIASRTPLILDHYEKVNKVTFDHVKYSIGEFDELKKSFKEAEKQKK